MLKKNPWMDLAKLNLVTSKPILETFSNNLVSGIEFVYYIQWWASYFLKVLVTSYSYFAKK